MKDSKNQKEEKKGNVMVLKALFPGDVEKIRITHEDGSVLLGDMDGKGSQNETTSEDIESTMACILERFEMLTDLVDGAENTDIVVLYGTLIRDARMQLNEMFTFIEEDIGEIRLRYEACEFNDRPRCVGAFVRPPSENRTRPYGPDPRRAQVD